MKKVSGTSKTLAMVRGWSNAQLDDLSLADRRKYFHGAVACTSTALLSAYTAVGGTAALFTEVGLATTFLKMTGVIIAAPFAGAAIFAGVVAVAGYCAYRAFKGAFASDHKKAIAKVKAERKAATEVSEL